MFIDYVPLLLVNMSAGLLVLAFYLVRGLDAPDQGKWAPALGIVGLVAFVNGLHMCWTWPLPGSYNVAFGEMSVLLGASFLGLAGCARRGWSPVYVGVYSLVAGLAAIVLGVSIAKLGLTAKPVLTAAGFVLSGLGGVLVAPSACSPRPRTVRIVAAVCLVAAAAIWAFVAMLGYWAHMEHFQKWQPPTMQVQKPAGQ